MCVCPLCVSLSKRETLGWNHVTLSWSRLQKSACTVHPYKTHQTHTRHAQILIKPWLGTSLPFCKCSVRYSFTQLSYVTMLTRQFGGCILLHPCRKHPQTQMGHKWWRWKDIRVVLPAYVLYDHQILRIAGLSIGSLIFPGLPLWYTNVQLKRPCMEKKHVCSHWCLARLNVGRLCVCLKERVRDGEHACFSLPVKYGEQLTFDLKNWQFTAWKSVYVCVYLTKTERKRERWECNSSEIFCSCLCTDKVLIYESVL